MPLVQPIPGQWKAGQLTRSGSDVCCVPAVFSKGGATKGQTVLTLTGTPTYGIMVQYSIDLVNVLNGQVSNQPGLFSYNRVAGAATLADFISKFGVHLSRYHDVELVSFTATTMTLRSAFWGFNPTLTIATPSLTSAAVLTSALTPSLLVPGDLVILNALSTGYTVSKFTTANITATSMYGVALDSLNSVYNDGRDQVVDIVVEGFVSCQAGGTAVKNAATSALTVFPDGTRPGMLGFGGVSNGATVALSVSTANNAGAPLAPVNLARQLRAVTQDVLPGQVFELRIDAI